MDGTVTGAALYVRRAPGNQVNARSPRIAAASRERAKRNAWLLALVALGVYAAIIVWHISRSAV